MAIFHASKKILSRKTGHRACAAAAYRAGELIADMRYNERHDYRRKSSVARDREAVGIAAPQGEVYSATRAELWNTVEAMEKHPRASLASEWTIALPNELSRAQNIALARDIAQALADSDKTLCDYCIHYGKEKKALFNDTLNENCHVHLMLPTRVFSGGELTKTPVAEYMSTSQRKKNGITTSRADDVKAQRSLIADVINSHLEKAGLEIKVDHRTLKEQGIDRPAQKHLSAIELKYERDGIKTETGDYNRLCNVIKIGDEEMEKTKKELLENALRPKPEIGSVIKPVEKAEKIKKAVPKVPDDLGSAVSRAQLEIVAEIIYDDIENWHPILDINKYWHYWRSIRKRIDERMRQEKTYLDDMRLDLLTCAALDAHYSDQHPTDENRAAICSQYGEAAQDYAEKIEMQARADAQLITEALEELAPEQ